MIYLRRLFDVESVRFYTVAQLICSFVSFIRNVFIVRLTTVEEFGIVSAVAIALTSIETITLLSLDRFLVYHKSGYKRPVLGTVNTLSIIRAVFLSLIVYCSAPFLAAIFNLEEYVWMFQVIALPVLARGFINYGFSLGLRELKYRSISFFELFPQVLSLAFVYPAFKYLGSLEASLFILLAPSMISVLVSHLVSTSGYPLSFSFPVVKSVWSYSWPLLMSGFIVAIGMQGDRLIIGSNFDIEVLAIFSAVYSLYLIPSTIFEKITTSYFLPYFSSRSLSGSWMLYFVCSSGAFLAFCGFVFIGPLVLGGIYGGEYIPDDLLLILISIYFYYRLIGAPQRIFPLTSGETKIILMGNLLRLIFFPLSFYLASQGCDIFTVVSVSISAEMASLFLSNFLNMKKSGSHQGWLTLSFLCAVPFSILFFHFDLRDLSLFKSLLYFFISLSVGLFLLCVLYVKGVRSVLLKL